MADNKVKEDTDMNDRKIHKVDTSKVSDGDIMAFVYYVKVKDSRLKDNLTVTGLDGGVQDIQIRGKELIENAFSADQYAEEEKVSKTRAAEILVHATNRPLTVAFEKQDGTERVLRGRLIRPEPLLGRSMMEDLDLTTKDRMRLVDHRSLKWLVCDGVKYIVK